MNAVENEETSKEPANRDAYSGGDDLATGDCRPMVGLQQLLLPTHANNNDKT